MPSWRSRGANARDLRRRPVGVLVPCLIVAGVRGDALRVQQWRASPARGHDLATVRVYSLRALGRALRAQSVLRGHVRPAVLWTLAAVFVWLCWTCIG